MQTIPKYVIVFVTSCMAIFPTGGWLDRGPDAKEINSYVSSGAFELGQLVGLGQSDLSLRFFLRDKSVPRDDSEGMGNRLTASQLMSNQLVIAPGANFAIGNIVSLDMKLGYGNNRMDAWSGQAGDENEVSEVVSQWRWFSSISLSSYHQVRGVDLHGRIGFKRLIMEDFVDRHVLNRGASSLVPGTSNQQRIDARLGLTLGRVEPFFGGLYAHRSGRIPSLLGVLERRRGGELTEGTSLGLRGGFKFVIGEMSGGIVGSRRLGDSGGGSNSLEGSIRIKF